MISQVSDKTVTCTIVGDGMVGKSQICKTFIGDLTIEDYEATVTNEHSVLTQFMGDKYTLRIVDSSGQHDYKELRTKSYKGSEVFILCYSLSDRDSFESIESFWIPEIRKICKKTPVILVATGKDIDDENNNVSKQEGLCIMDKHGIDAYVECSSYNKEEVNEVFEDVLLSVIKNKKRRRSSLLRHLLAR
ncbi:cdc42 homolog [Mytilus trossulus]|uniref:cdc42 homolog n=1 Tax=Mytilus trossulus TaxID=6551 RepID=UPI003006FCCC